MLRGISQTQEVKHCIVPLTGEISPLEKQSLEWQLPGAGGGEGGMRQY